MVFQKVKWVGGISKGIVHILRNHQGGFRNDHANVIFALSSAEFDYGGGLETDKK